jgi:tRNA modification GTPase
VWNPSVESSSFRSLRNPETIAAIATPPGRGAIAIVRASGPGVRDLARAAFVGPNLRPRVATLGTIVGGDGRTIDECLALLFPAPNSYTGEDVLELHVHGSVAVARETLVALLEAGARMAEPGEFTRRAFLAGKLDLSAAEAVAELIDAERRGEARAAAARLSGGLAASVERLRAALGEALAELAATLDFPDEVPGPSPRDLADRVDAIDGELAELAREWERGRIVRDGVSVAIVGPPNAGKSSLLNALLGVDRVLVSAIPGTTRDTVEEMLALGGGAVARIVDTAGLRRAADPLEAAGIVRSEAALAAATILIVVVDGSRPLDADARAALERTRGRERVVLFNKSDLGREGFDARDAAEMHALVGSAHAPATVDAVRAALASAVGAGAPDVARPSLGTARQADAVLEARRSLADARATLERGDPIDLVVGDLMAADAALGRLTGRDVSEAVLDAVFARFCVGK